MPRRTPSHPPAHGKAPSLARWLVPTCLAWTVAVTLLRGLRLPNDFAEAHWLLDYRFGFMKRGLVGSLCSLVTGAVGAAMTPVVIAVLSAVVLAGFGWALLVILRRVVSIPAHDPAAGVLLALVVATSPFIVMNGHLFGYFDALLFATTVGAIVLVRRDRPLLAALVQVAAVLTHESHLLVGYPLVILAALLGPIARTSGRLHWRHLAGLALPPAAGVALFFAHALLDGEVLRAQLLTHLGSFGFVTTRADFVATYQTTGFVDFFSQNYDAFLVRLMDPRILLSVAPTLVVCLYLAHAAANLAPFARTSLLVLTAVLTPLLMHTVAWDTERISTLTIGNAVIAVWILAAAGRRGGPMGMFPLLAVPALVLNVFYRIPLLDGAAERFSLVGRALLYAPTLAMAALMVRRSHRGVAGQK